MCFDGWCLYRADQIRLGLDAAMYALLRSRIVCEQQADRARYFDEVAATIPKPKRSCRNHPERWAQEGDLCRTCSRETP